MKVETIISEYYYASRELDSANDKIRELEQKFGRFGMSNPEGFAVDVHLETLSDLNMYYDLKENKLKLEEKIAMLYPKLKAIMELLRVDSLSHYTGTKGAADHRLFFLTQSGDKIVISHA